MLTLTDVRAELAKSVFQENDPEVRVRVINDMIKNVLHEIAAERVEQDLMSAGTTALLFGLYKMAGILWDGLDAHDPDRAPERCLEVLTKLITHYMRCFPSMPL